jgi:hypothetical protein
MIICASCRTQNYEGALLCKSCGSLMEFTIPERSLEDTPYIGTVLDIVPKHETFILEIDKHVLNLPINGTLTLGRKSASGSLNLFDLSSFDAQELGVSRNHARLQRAAGSILQITDLGSSNGTYINGERIQPHTPYQIYNGDEIRLASLTIQIRTR